MANSLKGSPLTIDTFGADVTIDTGDCRIVAILWTAYTSTKTVTFIDVDGNTIMKLEIEAGSSQFTPSRPANFSNGLVFDDSESDFEAGDFISIFID